MASKTMTTTCPRPHLGHRILGSAKALACSTFSGVPGIEAELRLGDPVGVGKRVAGPQGRPVMPVDCVRVVDRESYSRTINFRTKRPDDDLDLEDEFANFLTARPTLPPCLQLHGLLSTRSWLERQESSIHSQRVGRSDLDIPAWQRSSQGEVVYQDDGRPEWKWRHEWRRLDRESDSVLDIRDETRPLKLETELTNPDSNNKALARLQQLKLHLAAMDPRTRILAESWAEEWATQPERCDWTGDREEDRSISSTERKSSQEAEERYYFSCSKRECHHRLLRQTENLSLEIRQRVCVHDGCGFVSQTVDEWLRHVTGEHHADEQDARGAQGQSEQAH